ncbi:MAG: serine hydrolase [Candidatus Komeilibacteria bacterium]
MFWEFILNLGLLWGLVTLPVINPYTTINIANDGVDYHQYFSTEQQLPTKIINDSLGVKLSAETALAFDWETKAILWQQNNERQRPIASLTKLMTVLVWLENNPGWQVPVTISKDDYREGGTFYLFTGEVVTTEDLFYSTLIASDNNATIALVRSSGLSESDFVIKMNAKAKELRMWQTYFIEPTGLDNRNVSSANDLLRLISVAYENDRIKDAISRKDYSYSIRNTGRRNYFVSTDMLLDSYLDVLGGKTGYSDEAGGCLAIKVQDPEQHKIGVIILGSEDHYTRFDDAKALAQWTFDNFEWNND